MQWIILFCAITTARAETFVSGTPQTLRQAIQKALLSYAYSPPVDPQVGLDQVIEESVGDFMAQKFSVQQMRHQPCENILMETYTLLRGREPGGLKYPRDPAERRLAVRNAQSERFREVGYNPEPPDIPPPPTTALAPVAASRAQSQSVKRYERRAPPAVVRQKKVTATAPPPEASSDNHREQR